MYIYMCKLTDVISFTSILFSRMSLCFQMHLPNNYLDYLLPHQKRYFIDLKVR